MFNINWINRCFLLVVTTAHLHNVIRIYKAFVQNEHANIHANIFLIRITVILNMSDNIDKRIISDMRKYYKLESFNLECK